MIENIKLEVFKREYEKFRESQDYANRQLQTSFCEVARPAMLGLLKNHKITNEHLTALIQMFGHHCSEENFLRHLMNLELDKEAEDAIYMKFREIGQCGYTGRGKAAIKTLNEDQLGYVKLFLHAVAYANSKEQIKQAYSEYKEKRVPEVTSGVYSPWFYYLQPEICPLLTGPASQFLAQIGWRGDYGEAIDFFGTLRGEVRERDLGFIDAFLWEKERRDKIMRNIRRGPKSSQMALVEAKKQIILYGPPGTGKTYFTKKFTVDLLNEEK
jgi:hypothetical protein